MPAPSQIAVSQMPASKRKSARTKKSGESSEKLLAAASELFARYGYNGVSTGMVAEAAGLTQSMVHYHFANKAQLWEAVVKHLMEQRRQIFPLSQASLADLTPLAQLKVIVRLLIEVAAYEPAFGKIFLHESLAQSSRLEWLLDNYVSALFEVIDDAAERAIIAGQIRDIPLHDLSNIIIATGYMSFNFRQVSERLYRTDLSVKEHVKSLSDSYVTTIFEGLEIGGNGA